jgi:hypothetical protein
MENRDSYFYWITLHKHIKIISILITTPCEI